MARKQPRKDDAPLLVQRSVASFPSRAVIPISRITLISFSTMKIGMHPRTVARLDLLREIMGMLPVAFCFMPQGAKKWVERPDVLSTEVAEVILSKLMLPSRTYREPDKHRHATEQHDD